ncbi:MAG: hypothetical protein ACI808_001538, partial [Paraglaciecola sp.]
RHSEVAWAQERQFFYFPNNPRSYSTIQSQKKDGL